MNCCPVRPSCLRCPIPIVAIVIRRNGLELAGASINLAELGSYAERETAVPHSNLVGANRRGNLLVAKAKDLRLKKQ